MFRLIYLLLGVSVLSTLSAFDQQSTFPLTDADKTKIEADISFLKEGVSRISINDSYPGAMNVFGKFSYPLASNGDLIWTAARLGNGKICAFAANRFCDMDMATLKLYDNTRMVQNCINWISNNTSSAVGMIASDLEYNQGFVKSSKSSFQTLDDLNGIKFLVVLMRQLDTDSKMSAVKTFVEQGGGLMICSTSWLYNLYYEDYIGNRLIFDAGLSYVYGYDFSSKPITTLPSIPISDWWKNNPWYKSVLLLQQVPPTSPPVIDLLVNYTNHFPSYMFYNNYDFYPLVQLLGLKSIYDKYCCLDYHFPIKKADNLLNHTCVKFVNYIKYTLPINDDHPVVKAASIIPGYPTGSRENRTLTVTIPLNYKTRWQSTGIFMWPGSTLNVTVPSVLVDSNYMFQIGCHTDNLIDEVEFLRWPQITMKVPIINTNLSIRSLGGGLIFLNIDAIKTGTTSAMITFSGEIVSAPRFVLGKTTVDEWSKSVMESNSPFGEVESELFVSTVNTSNLKLVDNITYVTAWYDDIMTRFYNFTGSAVRPYKERLAVDKQIIVGYGHAGYPIFGNDGDIPDEFDSWSNTILRPSTPVEISGKYTWEYKDIWYYGIFHEIGHNFQRDVWTTNAEKEVTNDLMAIYFLKSWPDGPHQFGNNDFSPGKRKTSGDIYKLCFYVDLWGAFGFESFKQFFLYFEQHSELGYVTPRDVNDNWLKYYSQIVKRDITPLFITYKKDFSDGAKLFASQFPSWDINKIIDCGKAAFANSPCATLRVDSEARFNLSIMTWARINFTEALEINFKGAVSGSGMVVSLENADNFWSSTSYNPATNTLRMIPQKYVHPETSLVLRMSANNSSFTFTDVSIKIVDVKTSAVLHVQERFLENVYRV